MPKSLQQLLPDRPEPRVRIYAWTPNDPPAVYVGLVKVGQTTQEDVNARIRQSQGQMQQEYTLHVEAAAERLDGSGFRDTDVRRHLIDKGFENVPVGASREWMRCSPRPIPAWLTRKRPIRAA